MPFFSYKAIDSAGVPVKDEGEFPSLEGLFETLGARGLVLVDYRRRYIKWSSFAGGKVKRTLMAEFFRNLALLVRGGISLRQAIDDMARSPGIKTLRHVLVDVLRRLDGGQLLSSAMEANRRHFSGLLITLVSIGEETGNLDRMLDDAAAHLERIEEIVSNTKKALLYPSFVLTAMAGALAFWMIYVLPQILKLFKDMGIKDLPLATRILIKTVEIFNRWWPAAILVPVVAVIFYIIAAKNERMKYLWDLSWLRSPLIGDVLKSSQLAFFFEYMAVLTSAGINFVKGLEFMEASVTNQVLKKGIGGIRADITAGESIFESFSRVDFFEPFVLRMISAGEQTGGLPDQLALLAKHYRSKVNKFIDTMSKVIEPIIIVFAGLIFLIIALGLLGPIYDIITRLH
ncbi:MAG: type II secretion system F family protein [Desulfobacteraceae bacterium]|nr:type II secretion system F family protein [Desulfobacteraceae bacterium]